MKVIQRFNFSHLLGEGITWDNVAQVFYGVDIEGATLWSVDPLRNIVNNQPAPSKSSWCIPVCDSRLLLIGHKNKVSLYDPANFSIQRPAIQIPNMDESLRLNDAKTDSKGRIWMGSMSEANVREAKGALYCINNSGALLIKDEGYEIANGPAINLDETVMLHTDSSQGLIYRFDFNSLAGEITNKHIWLKVDPSDGSPDGMCFDDAGCVWVAHWGAGKVVKYHEDGKEIDSVAIPASQVSNVCFGGENLDRLFVTTARVGLSREQLQSEPAAGSIFEITGHQSKGIKSFPAAITFHE